VKCTTQYSKFRTNLNKSKAKTFIFQNIDYQLISNTKQLPPSVFSPIFTLNIIYIENNREQNVHLMSYNFLKSSEMYKFAKN
jgi:hypothetical protein